ncbi:MAG: 4-hydroxy-3-methylbut-2-enyl diphosphate reductase [Bacilli bacterium]|nr:4-hydroxy-3-methylbut-2-enyl diphosphate reductase [Bacilli bacterium]
MKVERIIPYGYCNGVNHAFAVINEAINNRNCKKIYLFGRPIHNEFAVNELISKGLIIINNESELENVENGSIVVFPAHGHLKHLDQIAERKKLVVYDAICPFIRNNVNKIIKKINCDEIVLLLGDKNHIEIKSILSISDNVYLLDKEILKKYQNNTNNKISLFVQSTLDKNDLSAKIKDIQDSIPSINIEDAFVCNATSERQNALKQIPSSCDLIIVIGDKTSNNTNKLFELAKSLFPHIETVFISCRQELDSRVLENKKHVVLTSGASTPKYLVDDVFDYLINAN